MGTFSISQEMGKDLNRCRADSRSCARECEFERRAGSVKRAPGLACKSASFKESLRARGFRQANAKNCRFGNF